MRACFTTLSCDDCSGDHYADEPCGCLGAAVLEERLAAALRREAALKDQIAQMICQQKPIIVVAAAQQ